MNFNLCRHGRLAGCVATFIGLYLNNWTLIMLGNLIVLVFYMWSIAKIERFLERLTEVKENAIYPEK